MLEIKEIKAVRKSAIITPDYVYNLRVKDNHNYFAHGVLVHNCDDP